MATVTPDCILYAQHGWADGHRSLAALAHHLAKPQTIVVTPNLGYFKTWLRIEPLIQAVEALATEMITSYPMVPMRIIGHSMGGLIWLEVLHRHPEWWSQVESLVLVASPVGGADLGRLFDPWEWGLGIARDLGRNRRSIAETIAAVIPTLMIAGDVDQGSDGTITVGSTQFRHAKFIRLVGIAHAALRNHPAVAEAIQEFWNSPETPLIPADKPSTRELLIQQFQQFTWIADAHPRDFPRSQVWHTLSDGSTIRLWKHPLGIDHIFIADSSGNPVYGGFVGWRHAEELRRVLEEIRSGQWSCSSSFPMIHSE